MTALDMKDIGRTTKLMAGEDLFMQMEMFTKVNGKMIKLTVKEFTLMLMGQDMKVTGLKINSTEKE